MSIEPASASAPTSGIDTRGIPTHVCLNCGSRVFKVAASFEDYDIAMWGLEAECYECGAPVTAPCPVDDPGWTGPNPLLEEADEDCC